MHARMLAIAVGAVLAMSMNHQALAQDLLDAKALAACANKAQQLQFGSGELHQRLDMLASRRRTLLADSETIGDGASPELTAARRQHDQTVVAFNADIATVRRDIQALNQVKADYDRDCSGRPYRRADLDAMPASAREAMRGGLANVQVPYLDPALQPLP